MPGTGAAILYTIVAAVYTQQKQVGMRPHSKVSSKVELLIELRRLHYRKGKDMNPSDMTAYSRAENFQNKKIYVTSEILLMKACSSTLYRSEP